MALSVDWGTKVITVPQNYLAFVSGSLYELDVEQFFRDLRDIEDDEAGQVHLPMVAHKTKSTLSGVTYARVVEIVNGYTVTFEDGQYRVRLVNANNNISDVANLNQVSIITQNSAGLQLVTSGSAVTEQDKVDIADTILARNQQGGSDGGFTVAQALASGSMRMGISNGTLTVYYADGSVAFTRALTHANMKAITQMVP